MACLSWLMNLGFGGSGVPPQNFTGSINVTISSFLLPQWRLSNSVFPVCELKSDFGSNAALMSPLATQITLTSNLS